jgi:4-amino-4-deoxy-L-arabinose transferase-like glycosyltransferase
MQSVSAVISPPKVSRSSQWISTICIVALGLALFAIRATGPADLADGYHQERAAAYVMDVLRNGNWICQYGAYGEVTSKPPMFTWLAALANSPFLRPNWFALLLPGALATLAIAGMIFLAGKKFFGRTAGFLAALAYLMSSVGMKQIGLARIDGLFACTVMIAALLGFRAWEMGREWTWFWLAAAVATLTKGPLGVLLGGMGLLVAIWERRRVVGNHWLGIGLFFAITGGWLWLAYRKIGQPLIDTMLGKELVGHALTSEGNVPGQFAYLPVVYFLGRFAPWSVLAFVGFWRIWKHPAVEENARRFERFVFCWFWGGLIVFSLAPHQRPDLIFPLIPAGALIAGRELARFIEWKHIALAPVTAVIIVIGLGAAITKYHVTERNDPQVIETRALREMAKKMGGIPLVHVDSPYALQFFVNTKQPYVTRQRAAELLRQEQPVFVATMSLEGLGAVYPVAEWRGRKRACYIVSNRPLHQ